MAPSSKTDDLNKTDATEASPLMNAIESDTNKNDEVMLRKGEQKGIQ